MKLNNLFKRIQVNSAVVIGVIIERIGNRRRT